MDDKHLRNLDTPWHIGIPTKKENDPRRHQARCRHYIFENKGCKAGLIHCPGSAHCQSYRPLTEEEYKEECSRRRKLKSKERKNRGNRKVVENPFPQRNTRRSYVVGGCYNSKQYGQGYITGVNEGVITVRFEKGPIVKIDVKSGRVINPVQPLLDKQTKTDHRNTIIPKKKSNENQVIIKNKGAQNKPIVGKNQLQKKQIEIVNHIVYGKGKVIKRYKNNIGKIVVTVQFFDKYAFKRDFIWEQEKGCFN